MHLRRITSGGAYLPAVDGLRFIAIAAVVLYHIQGYVLETWHLVPTTLTERTVAAVLGAGHYGVQLFFAISGYILARPFAAHALTGGKPVSLRAYFRRRLTRLEPPYLISLAAFAVLLVVFVGKPFGEVLPHLAASAVYAHNLTYGTLSTINTVAWSLEIEIQFYVLVPLLAQVFTIRSAPRRRAAFILLAGAAIAAQVFFAGNPRFDLSIGNALQYFLMGMLAADLHVSGAMVGWPLARVNRILSLPPLATIGGMCYSIYLLHYPLISVMGRTVPVLTRDPLRATLSAAVLWLPAILFVSALYFVLIERPCMRADWPQRLWAWLRLGSSAERAAVP